MKEMIRPYRAIPSAMATKIMDLPNREPSSLIAPRAALAELATAIPEPIPDNTELENTDGNNLEESILQWLAEGQVMPTPTARDWKGAPSLENLKKRGKIPQKNSLPDFFARTGKSFQLNPLFVAEMMGFPVNWTVLPFLPGGNSL